MKVNLLLLLLMAVSTVSSAKKDFVIPESLILQVQEGNAEIAFFIGSKFYEGSKEFKADKEKAIEWYKKAAKMGYAQAMLELGYHYHDENDKEQALSWFQKASENGLGEASNMIGTYYFKGEAGLEKNCQTAYQWYEKAEMKLIKLAFNNHAWNLATASDPKCRSPEKALKVVFDLLDAYSDDKIPWYVWDTKAAVHAAIADFGTAINTQQFIIEEMEKSNLDTESYKKRLEYYLQRKNYIDNDW